MKFDLRPGNIIYSDEEDKATIIDFGSCRHKSELSQLDYERMLKEDLSDLGDISSLFIRSGQVQLASPCEFYGTQYVLA